MYLGINGIYLYINGVLGLTGASMYITVTMQCMRSNFVCSGGLFFSHLHMEGNIYDNARFSFLFFQSLDTLLRKKNKKRKKKILKYIRELSASPSSGKREKTTAL
jgi:hypothetical protein